MESIVLVKIFYLFVIIWIASLYLGLGFEFAERIFSGIRLVNFIQCFLLAISWGLIVLIVFLGVAEEILKLKYRPFSNFCDKNSHHLSLIFKKIFT